jgi:hypothetical protein
MKKPREASKTGALRAKADSETKVRKGVYYETK